ncbi:MAG TPA: CHASE4 domain-containing protein, partial [Planctomycetota bacterium]|nr:CHASE4 domain-containing protein [Planctomycetota bacterium]
MKSLRTRIIALGALIALGSALICAITAVLVAQRNIVAMEAHQADDAVVALQRRLAQLLDELSFEVDDYGNWDELYAQMPSPDPAWARLNLTPGKVRGALTQFFLTGDQQRITGRFHDGEVRGSLESSNDPATAEALAPLLGHAKPLNGIGIFAGHPALYAATPVRRSDRLGDPRGTLIALAYLDTTIIQRLGDDGWMLRVEPQHGGGSAALGGSLTTSPGVIHRDAQRLMVTTTVTTHDGILHLLLSTNRTANQRIGDDTVLAIVVTGLLVAIGAMLLGTWLGWRWIAPISALATACRDQVQDPHVPLPTNSGLLEADVLSESMRQLVLRLRVGQDELAHALDRETTTNAIHRRFLTQLGHEFGQPIRQIITLCAKVDHQSGHLDPEEVAVAKQLAKELEQRFQEILGLVDLSPDAGSANQPLAPDHYLTGIAGLMRPQADKAGMTIHIDAPADAVAVDPGLLSPVLVNLCSNAIKVGRPGGIFWLKCASDSNRSAILWMVKDNGPGFPEILADRVRDAFTRGEVLPGTLGIGMGLTLVLANVRTMGGTMMLANQSEPGATIIIR